MAGSQGTRLVRLLSWAQNPYIKRHNIAFCLLCDHLAEINERLIGSAHVATLEVAMPDALAREEFATWYDSHDGKLGNLTDFTPKQLAELTAGLNLVNLERLLARAGPVGAKARRPGTQATQEGTDRAPGARAGRVRRAAAHARRLRGQRRRQAPAGRRRGAAGQGPARRRADGLSDLRAGRHRQDLPGRMLRRLGRHPVRQAAQLPVQVRRRDRGQPGADPQRAAGDGAGRRRDRRGRRRPGQPRRRRRFGDVEPGLLDDRLPDGRHALSRQAALDAADQPARPAADRPETAGPRRGPPAPFQPERRCRGRRS